MRCWMPVVIVSLAACGSKSPTPAKPAGPVEMTAEVITVPGDPDAAPLPLDPQIRRGVLPNGLTYYVMPHKKPEQRAALWLAVNAGAVLEDDDQRGLAHFVEHMAFNGTRRFPKQQIVDYIERSGMRFGADLNAYTSFDQTVYQLTVPTDDKTEMARGLDILRDWAGDVSFDPVEVDKERGVVLEEWRLGRGADARIFDKQFPVMFKGSKYADRIVIGQPQILKTAPRDTLYRFYKDWYQPQNMAVIAVGDFDDKEMEKAIKAKFDDLKATPNAKVRTAVPTPKDHPTLVTIETDKEMPYTSIAVYNKLDHRTTSSKKEYRRLIVEGLYHAMLNARFEELGEDPDAPFVFAGSGTGGFVRTCDTFQRFATAKEGRVEDTLAVLFKEIARVEKFGFLPSELARVAKARLARAESDAAEWEKHPSSEIVDELTRNFFDHEETSGRANELAMERALIPTITLAELGNLARSWGGDTGRVIAISGPAKAKMPTQDQVLAIVKAPVQVEAWKDEGGDRPLIATPPAPGKVTKTTHDDATDTTTWQLANGVKVIVKPTTFQNDEVEFTGYQRGGSSLVADKDWANARFAGAIVDASGAGDLDPTALRKVLADKVADANVWLGELSESVDGSARPSDLDAALQLTYLKLTAPRKDAKAFTAWKNQQHEDLRNKKLDPERTFFEEMEVVTSSNHPRYLPATDDLIDKIDHDKALAIYKQRFADLGDFTFVFVGNIDLAKLQPLVETYLGSLPSKGRHETWKDVGVKFPSGKVEKTYALGSEPKSYFELSEEAPEKWTIDGARDAQILAMVLRIRLREVLREDMGGVYGVSVWTYLAREPRQLRALGVSFGCDPDNVAALKKATFDEIGKVAKDGIGPDYLAKVTETIKRTRETDARTNRWWMNQLRQAAYFGDDFGKFTDLDAAQKRVTSDNVKASAKRFFDPNHYVLGVMKPVKK